MMILADRKSTARRPGGLGRCTTNIEAKEDFMTQSQHGLMSETQMNALSELQKVFSHLESDCTIAAWLTPEQDKALDAYRAAFDLKPVTATSLPESTTEDERAHVAKFR